MKDMGPDMVNFDFLLMNIPKKNVCLLPELDAFFVSVLFWWKYHLAVLFLQRASVQQVYVHGRLCLRPGSHFQGGLGCLEHTKRFLHPNSASFAASRQLWYWLLSVGSVRRCQFDVLVAIVYIRPGFITRSGASFSCNSLIPIVKAIQIVQTEMGLPLRLRVV